MTAKMYVWNGVTRLDLPPDRILEAAKGKLKRVVVIGWEDTEEEGFYAASSYADGGDVLWLIELLKKAVLGG